MQVERAVAFPTRGKKEPLTEQQIKERTARYNRTYREKHPEVVRKAIRKHRAHKKIMKELLAIDCSDFYAGNIKE